MPNYKGHITGGIITYAVILVMVSKFAFKMNTNYLELILWMILCIAGALFPDIDTKSKGQKIFYGLFALIIFWAITHGNWTVLSVASVITVIPLISSHRGIAHNTWFVIGLPLIIPFAIGSKSQALFNKAFIAYLFFTAGALSHLVLDFGLVRFLRRSFSFSKHRYKRRR